MNKIKDFFLISFVLLFGYGGWFLIYLLVWWIWKVDLLEIVFRIFR
jgi:hypothetical protein